nr:MAG: hypothetical protein [Molluscum contagiosum virus]
MPERVFSRRVARECSLSSVCSVRAPVSSPPECFRRHVPCSTSMHGSTCVSVCLDA